MSRTTKNTALFAASAIAVALSLGGPAFAADAPAGTAAAPQPAPTREDAPKTGTLIRKTEPTKLDPILVGYRGAVVGKGDAQWTDDDASAQDLPMHGDTAAQ